MFDFIGREHCHTLTSSQGSILSPETPWCGKCRHGAIFLTRSAHFYGQPFPRSAPPHLSRDKIDRQLLTNLLSMFLYGTVMNLTDQFSSQLCMLILSDCNSALTVTKDYLLKKSQWSVNWLCASVCTTQYPLTPTPPCSLSHSGKDNTEVCLAVINQPFWGQCPWCQERGTLWFILCKYYATHHYRPVDS